MDRFGMRMAVPAFSIAHIDGADLEIIVHILKSPGRHFFQQSFHIGNKQGFSFIDNNGHRRVQTLDINHSVFDAGLFNFLLDFVSDVDKIQSGGSFHLDDMVNNFHEFSLVFSNGFIITLFVKKQ
jgi:hypothetical protein